MAHKIAELKDTVLRNLPWYHETGAVWQEVLYLGDSHLGGMVPIQTQSLEA